MNINKVLILGGSGFVGRHVCEKLARTQCRVTLATRRRVTARDLWMLPLVDVIEIDVHDEAALTRLVAGHDAVINLVGILHGSEAEFNKVHVELPQKIARACAVAHVKRVVHVSALGAAADAPSRYQRSKARGEEALQSATGLDVTILRPSVIFGEGDRLMNLFTTLQSFFPFIPLGGASAKFQPVWVEDVANAVVNCLQHDNTIGHTYEACGTEVLTLKQMVQLAGRYSGCERPVISLPIALGHMQAWFMEFAPGKPMLSRDNMDSMKVDNTAGGKLMGLQALGITPSALSAVAPTYLGVNPGGQGPRSELIGMRKTAGRF